MINYKEYYIAFLDILGFSSKIWKEDATIIHGIFTRIKALKRITRGTAFDGHAATELEQNTKFLFFSDTIVCAIPTSIYGAFETLTSHCMMIQHYLYSEESPVLLRGAIVKGEMYINGSEMFGPGLIDAYRMEESLAIYPRIIMTRGTYVPYKIGKLQIQGFSEPITSKKIKQSYHITQKAARSRQRAAFLRGKLGRRQKFSKK